MNSLEAWSPLWEPSTFYPRDPDAKYKAEFHIIGAKWIKPSSVVPYFPWVTTEKEVFGA